MDNLEKKYPDRKWSTANFGDKWDLEQDVVICADVIEHLVDPDELIQFIKNLKFTFLVLSTPDRSLMYKRWQRGYYGPPRNPAHVREWTRYEFLKYISRHFDILDHQVTNLAQVTQMMICTKKN